MLRRLSFRADRTLPSDDFTKPEIYWAAIRQSMREKSNHNKLEAQAFFFATIVFSIAAPLFIAFGVGIFWGKILPAVLAAMVTASTAWLQLRQPQKLWTIYRRAQRELEDEKVKFDNEIGVYENAVNKKKMLAERTADIAMDVHRRWEGLVPDSAGLGILPRTGGNERNE